MLIQHPPSIVISGHLVLNQSIVVPNCNIYVGLRSEIPCEVNMLG